MNSIDELLGSLGNSLGLDDMALDSNGYAVLLIDDVAVNIESCCDGAELVLYTQLGELNNDNPSLLPIYRELLAANFFHIGTSNATLGVDPDAGTVAFVHRLQVAGLTATNLEATIEKFADACDYWTHRIGKLARANTPAAATQQPGNSGLRV